jgi:IclR family pca regulon transcriptional regulator
MRRLPSTSWVDRAPEADLGPQGGKDRYFVEALAQGLAVLRAFEQHPEGMNLAEIARQLGCSRTQPFRYVHTLERLGYLQRAPTGGVYRPTPKCLALGHSYLSGQTITELAQPMLERLKNDVRASAHLGVLDQGELVYIGSSRTAVVTAINIGIGTRLPATATSIGRILLAYLEPADVDVILGAGPIRAMTAKTLVDPTAFRRTLMEAREQGYAFTDEEFHVGVRSIAAPVRDARGCVVAGINATAITQLFTDDCVRQTVIPAVRRAAEELSMALGYRRATN